MFFPAVILLEQALSSHCFAINISLIGVEMDSEAVSEVHLRVANYFKDIPISMLSDEKFTEVRRLATKLF